MAIINIKFKFFGVILLWLVSIGSVCSQTLVSQQGNFFGEPIIIETGCNGVVTSSALCGFVKLEILDIDNDGDDDIISGNGNTLHWYENTGNGIFDLTKNIIDYIGHSQIEIVDINNDSFKDIVIWVNTQTGPPVYEIGNYLNLGNGTFGSFNLMALHQNAAYLEIAESVDINNDGFTDLIYEKNHELLWMPNSQTGFSNPMLIDSSFATIGNIESVDLLQTGVKDIFVSGYNYIDNLTRIVKYPNDSNGNFGAPQIIIDSIAAATLGNWFDLKDMNGDGFLDFIYIQDSLGTVISLTDSAGNIYNEISTNDSIETSQVVDFDFDGDFDLLTNYSSGMQYALINDGTGVFSVQPLEETPSSVRDFKVADLVPNNNEMELVYYVEGLSPTVPNRLDYIYKENTGYNIRNVDEVSTLGLIMSDFNNDGIDDFVTGAEVNNLYYFENEGNLSFQKNKINVEANVGNPGNLSYDKEVISDAGDVDLNGFVDLYVLDPNDHLYLCYNFSGLDSVSLELIDSTIIPFHVNSIDVDNDGVLECLAYLWNNGSSEVSYYKRNVNGTWDLIVVDSNIASVYGSKLLDNADINNDGFFDIVFYANNNGGNPIYWYENDGSGGFGIKHLVNDTSNYTNQSCNMIVSYFDNDSFPDIITEYQDVTNYYINDGSGNFTLNGIAETPFDINAVEIWMEDLNNDGYSDIVKTGYHSIYNFNVVCLYENQADSLMQLKFTYYYSRSNRNRVAFSDFDFDNDKDILIGGTDHNGMITVFENYTNDPNIQGYVFWDENQNKTKDLNECGLNSFQVNIQPTSISNIANSNGEYDFVVSPNQYNISYLPIQYWELTTDSMEYNIITNNTTHIDNLNFGFYPTDSISSLDFNLLYGYPRCDQLVNFYYSLTNSGTTKQSGTLWTSLDSTLIDSVQFVDVPDTIFNATNFGWHFNNLYPFETLSKNIIYEIPSIDNGIEIGDNISINSTAEFSNVLGNFVSDYNNEFPIFCAFDPNDKLVSPNRPGDLNYTLFDERIHYTIRFQNTGNDTAFNISIYDTISADLSMNSLIINSSSHMNKMTVSKLGNTVLVFSFDNIMLPDSGANFLGSQGYVNFSLESQENLPEETALNNTAYIYFDNNPPIKTNTTLNTLVSELPSVGVSVNDLELNELDWKVYPNPAANLFSILPVDGFKTYEINIFNLLGQEIFSRNEIIGTSMIYTKYWDEGVYVVRFKNKDSYYFSSSKFMIQH